MFEVQVDTGFSQLTAKTTIMFSMTSPRISEDELKAVHMLMSASSAAGSTGVSMARRSLRLFRCWQNPQMARTALILTTVIWSACRPRTVASTKVAVDASLSWSGNLLPIQRQRPNRNGEAAQDLRLGRQQSRVEQRSLTRRGNVGHDDVLQEHAQVELDAAGLDVTLDDLLAGAE